MAEVLCLPSPPRPQGHPKAHPREHQGHERAQASHACRPYYPTLEHILCRALAMPLAGTLQWKT